MRFYVVLVFCSLAFMHLAHADQATIRETTLEIPTYALGPADKNPPLWNEKVYPYPMQTAVSSARSPPMCG